MGYHGVHRKIIDRNNKKNIRNNFEEFTSQYEIYPNLDKILRSRIIWKANFKQF